MSLTLSKIFTDRFNHGLHTVAQVVLIRRTDGEAFRFTDHNREIWADIHDEGEQKFSPVNGATMSALERQAYMLDENLTLAGFFDADEITDEDMHAGRFDGATMVVALVDWKIPWGGAIYKVVFEVGASQYTGERWEAEIIGQSQRLKPQIGFERSRTCPYKLGDPDTCKADLSDLTRTDLWVSQVNSDNTFDVYSVQIPGGLGDDYFAQAELVWGSGKNQGLRSVVKAYDDSSRRFTLQELPPFTIEAEDVIDILEPGCSHTFSGSFGCVTLHNNGDNFGGYLFQPGTDGLLETPARTTG